MRTVLLLGLLTLAGCGAAGAPVKPQISGSATLGVNSNSGAYTDTEIAISIPLN
jgi:hypothetical protein